LRKEGREISIEVLPKEGDVVDEEDEEGGNQNVEILHEIVCNRSGELVETKWELFKENALMYKNKKGKIPIPTNAWVTSNGGLKGGQG